MRAAAVAIASGGTGLIAGVMATNGGERHAGEDAHDGGQQPVDQADQ
jgi:hypothetical protein